MWCTAPPEVRLLVAPEHRHPVLEHGVLVQAGHQLLAELQAGARRHLHLMVLEQVPEAVDEAVALVKEQKSGEK